MKSPIRAVRIAFLALCLGGGVLVNYSGGGGDLSRHLIIAAILGLLLTLVDMLLKGFSLRSLTGLTLGLAVGALISYFISVSPLMDDRVFGHDQTLDSNIFAARIILFLASTYLATVITLRSRDEFNLVIPYIRFNALDTPHHLIVLDTSALIDGRIVGLADSGFLTAGLVLPRFVIEELQAVADSNDPAKRARGRRGLANLNALKDVKNVALRIHESGMGHQGSVDDRLVALSLSLKAGLLTTDYNLAQVARFHGVKWLNLNTLAKGMKVEVAPGDVIEVELAREGREPGQAIGHLPDGSMVVVLDGAPHIGKSVAAEVTNITPTNAGRMIFAKTRAIV